MKAPAEDAGYAAFAKTIDTVILGHRTYCQIHDELSPAIWPYAGMQSYVLTHQARSAQEGVRFVCQPVTALIHTLKQEQGKDAIWICGGSDVIDQCVRADLIDEYHITTLPLIFRRRHPAVQVRWTHAQAEALLRVSSTSRLVNMIYERKQSEYDESRSEARSGSSLRAPVKAHGVDAYIVPTSDFHETEYVCDHFEGKRVH